jgi:NhaP-type Na+/H+ or K+/H+ antiporter
MRQHAGTAKTSRSSSSMDPYVVVLAGFGVVVLLTAWLPMVMKALPLSLPIFCVALGAAVFAIPGLPGQAPHPMSYPALTQRLTELVVLVALMGTGLKLDRPFAPPGSAPTWRLLVVAMPLTIAAVALLGTGLLGLSAASAILLAAALAPTDPVLASDVQAGPPQSGEEDDVRYTLTSEAGLNDGLAFPFVNLAIAIALSTATGEPWFGHWVMVDVIWKLATGVAVGWCVGRALGWLTFKLPNRAKLSRTGDGFVALGITAVSYGLTEMAHGYGFLAVFVSAVTFRNVERGHTYHERLHDFIEQLERLLMMVLLVVFGGSLSDGGLIAGLDWRSVAFALAVLFLVRPIAGWFSLAGLSLPADERAVISIYGIRGIGSIYYLSYAFNHAPFTGSEVLWRVTGLIILLSVLLHGASVTPVMSRLDRRRQRRIPAASPQMRETTPA